MSHSIVIRIVDVSLGFISLDLEEGGGVCSELSLTGCWNERFIKAMVFFFDPISSKFYIFNMIACI